MLCLLGRPGVALDGQIEPLVLRPKAVALLAYLALNDRPIERRELARLLFPAAVEPLAALRWHLSYLRTAGPDLIARDLAATRDRIALRTQTDVSLFLIGAEYLCAHPDAADAAEILALYRDDLLAGLAVSATAEFDTWLYVEQEALRRLFRRAAVAFARWALDHGTAAAAEVPLARLTAVEPYFEDGHALLIEAYEALHQHDHAVAAYERYQRMMRMELRAEPRHAVARRFEPQPVSQRVEPVEALVPLRDVTVHVVDWPGGEPPILAIHGSGGSAYALGTLGERLAPAHRFVAVDLRGHGFSDKPPTGYGLTDHIDDICQLIEALNLRRPVLLGFSAGGAIATLVATRADVGGLVLLEGMVGDRAFTENAAAQAAPILASLDRRIRGFDEYLAQYRAQRPAWSDDAERLLDRWTRYEFAPLSDGTYRRRALRVAVEAEWASIAEADSLGALAQVTCPTLIVRAKQSWWGDRPYFTDAIVAAQRRAVPSAALYVAEHRNHATMVRDPEPEMIAAIRRLCGDRD